jgi:1,4-dihydroxy-2-naphthoyl-CoA synthase
LLVTEGSTRRVLLATGLVATVKAETGKTAGNVGGDSKGFGNPSKAANVGSKTSKGSWLIAGGVSVFKLVVSEGLSRR